MVHDLDTRLALTASWWPLELVTWQALLSLVPCQLLALSLGTASVLVQIDLILNAFFEIGLELMEKLEPGPRWLL